MSKSVSCFGVCKGRPGWKDPDTGLHCTVCGGSGVYTAYNQREMDLAEYRRVMASRAEAAEKRAPWRR